MNNLTYLDNAAAMPVSQDILDSFKEYSLKYFANPEAAHGAGRDAFGAIRDASVIIVDNLTHKEDHYLSWTASATEAINIAFSYPHFKGKTIVTTDAEHSAVASVIAEAGFSEIRKVAIGNDGQIDLNDLIDKLDNDVAVVATHHVQNETGAIQDLKAIRSVIDEDSPEAVFMVDTVQSIGKIPIPWKEAGINIGFIGGHKVGAPSGGALLYNFSGDHKLLFSKYVNAVRTEKHFIGRPDIAICLTLGDAVINASDLAQYNEIKALNEYLRKELSDLKTEMGLDLAFPVPEDISSPYIETFLIPPYQAEVLVRMLSDKGVMVSAGSACSASKTGPSSTLLAMGISPADARTAIRVSFSFDSTQKDVDRFIEALKNVIEAY